MIFDGAIDLVRDSRRALANARIRARIERGDLKEPTKTELWAMLAEAVANTAKLQGGPDGRQ
jgi:hypothetical protein